MVGIVSNIASSFANISIRNNLNSANAAFENVLEEFNDDGSSVQAIESQDEIISEQTNEFLNGEGGVSGFVEENFQSGQNLIAISNPSQIEEPADKIRAVPVQDDSFFEATNNAAKAKIAFESSVATRVELDEQCGNILDLFDEKS